MISVISPVADEAENLRIVIPEVCRGFSALSPAVAWEYILVDDHSTDASAAVIRQLSGSCPNVRYLLNGYAPGQVGCQRTGIEQARGDFCIFMDADGEVVADDIPALVGRYHAGDEIVATYCRTGRQSLPSLLGNIVMRLVFRYAIRESASHFLGVQRRFLLGAPLRHDDQRYLIPIAIKRGARRIAEVEVRCRARVHGRSKYSRWKKAALGIGYILLAKYRIACGDYAVTGK